MSAALKTIYVGNLPFSTTEEEVRALFTSHGTVQSVTLILDQETGRSRGFCFVEMSLAEAMVAVEALDGALCEGNTLRVNEARDRGAKPPRRPW